MVGTLLLSCPDQKGIIAAVTQMLYGLGANIVDADQHTDPVAAMFFQRIAFESDRTREDIEAAVRALAPKFQLAWTLAFGRREPHIALFCSKQEHCLYDLLIRYRAGEFQCHIS